MCGIVGYIGSRMSTDVLLSGLEKLAQMEGLTLQGGRLHAMSQPVSSNMRDNFATFYAGPVNSPWVAYFGGDWLDRHLETGDHTMRGICIGLAIVSLVMTYYNLIQRSVLSRDTEHKKDEK